MKSGSLCFLRKSISQRVSSLYVQSFSYHFHIIFWYICRVCSGILCFISNIDNFCIFTFFLLSLASCLSTLLIFSKNQLLVSLIFSIVLLFPSSLISALMFIISFLLFALGLFCSFDYLFATFFLIYEFSFINTLLALL